MSKEYINAGVTLIVGLLAFIVYKLQRRDAKKDAAKILLNEITSAQDSVIAIKKGKRKGDQLITGEESIMPSRSWEKYKHLFVSDFEARDWTRISEFYKQCAALDKAIELQASFFDKNQQAIRTELYSAFNAFVQSELAKAEEGAYNVTLPDGTTKVTDEAAQRFQDLVGTKISGYADLFIDLLKKNRGIYSPVKPLEDAEILVQDIETKLLDSDAGRKLKSIAHRRWL